MSLIHVLVTLTARVCAAKSCTATSLLQPTTFHPNTLGLGK